MDTLHRFIEAQEANYTIALHELKAGRKESHWMWYIFPQLDGLGGNSPTAKRYAIYGAEEAGQYLTHPVLGQRLITCAETLLYAGRTVDQVFEFPDDLKFKSSITLFNAVTNDNFVLQNTLDRVCNGEQCSLTLELLATTTPLSSASVPA